MSPAAINFITQTAIQYFSQMVAGKLPFFFAKKYSCDDNSAPHDSSYGYKLDNYSYLDKLL